MKRKFVFWNGNKIPAEIAQLGAWKDAGSRQLEVPCDECGTVYKLCTSDSAAVCQDCFDMAGLENQIGDTTHDAPEMPVLQQELAAAQSQLEQRKAHIRK